MFAGYDGALAEAQRACSALRADDALRRKIEPELRKIEVAAERGLLVEMSASKRRCSPSPTK